jgi:serine/threonine protein phosphatase PrpC
MNEVPILGHPILTFAEECDRGTEREENQDSVLHARIPLGELMIVADGIGGYKGGATASRMVVEGFHASLKALPRDASIEQAIRDASAQTNAGILAAASAPDSPYRRMGSTIVLALLEEAATGINAWIAHIGDSRAYLLREGRLSRITNDHSAVQALLNQNLITPEEAFNHPDASVLTRSLGHQEQVEIDIDMIPLEIGDNLLLCSDGLWGYVPGEDIQSVAANPVFSVQAVAKNLLQLAINAGGHDNIGIEIARVHRPPAPTVRIG